MTDVATRRDEAATALTRAISVRKDAEAVVYATQKAYDEACIDYGRANPPEGFKAGDKVRRNSLRRGSYGFGMYSKKTEDKYVKERGVVTLCAGQSHYRNHYPKPGEWFVLSASGHTAYSMFDKDGVTTWTKEA